MALSVYIETTIVSFLTARPSRDVIARAHQEITRKWWRTRRAEFELFASPFVLQEAAGGDPAQGQLRLAALKGIPLLALTPQANHLAAAFIARGPIPRKANIDAIHIGIAAAHGVNYLMTWNCAHIANASMRGSIEDICRSMGCEPPILCTPEELMEG
jgi:hypothetical protein